MTDELSVFSKGEIMQEYPVVKMKHLLNYKVGDVVRLKKTGELVEITKYGESVHCGYCALFEVYNCSRTNCSQLDGNVYFKPVWNNNASID